MPKISLIIPVYNVASFIKRCVDSIAQQSFTDFEAIFVDDGSTDNSREICCNLIEGHPNMRLLTKENGGLSSARLYGLYYATGEYVAFIDSDDYIAPDYLEALYDTISSTSADICMCNYNTDRNGITEPHAEFVSEDCKIIEGKDIFEEYVLPQLPSDNAGDTFLPSFMWLRLFRREILTEEYFVSEREYYQEDLACSLLMYRNLRKIAIINKPLYYYCLNSGSLTLKYREGVLDMMLRLYDLIEGQTNHYQSPEITNRKNTFLFRAILFSLRNESQRGFRQYTKVTKKIISNKRVKRLFSETKINTLQGMNKVLALCYLTNSLPILYFYYKIRLRIQ